MVYRYRYFIDSLYKYLTDKQTETIRKESEQIEVLYVDVLGRKVMPVQQKYTKLSQTDYKYENVQMILNL